MGDSFSDKVKKSWEDLQAKSDNLKVQWELGKQEAGDKWEEDKKSLREKATEMRQHVNELKKKNKERGEEFQAKLDHLEVQAALGKAEHEDKLKEQETEVKRALHDFNTEMEKKWHYWTD